VKDNTDTARDAEALTALLAAAPDATDHAAVRGYLHALTALGGSVLLIMPGLKTPADMRTSQKRIADDRKAQAEAEAAGRRKWARVRSPAGVHLATDDTALLDGYLDRYLKHYAPLYPDGPVPVNLAVSLGPQPPGGGGRRHRRATQAVPE
jgi:hypothetical protein